MNEYIPFSEEWHKEMMRLKKGELVKFIVARSKRVAELEAALVGISGASVYRHSHEDVSKELGAVRRFAAGMLPEQLE